MTAKDYVEAIAAELSRARGGGLVLSPADTQLALSWHAARVPLAGVLEAVRKARRRRPAAVRGAGSPALSLQQLALSAAIPAEAASAKAGSSLELELLQAARRGRVPAGALWEKLALRASALLAASADAYWTEAIGALQASLRQVPRASALAAGAALRARMGRRPTAMPRRHYRRSLQMKLLAAASERLDLPPRAFLL